MAECLISDIINNKMRSKERVRIQTSSGSTHEGTISSTDCMGVLFIPENKELDPAYILFTDIKKFMLPEHKV